jgi:hypothetical protein
VVNDIDGCYLYDIDDLEAVVEATLSGRRREAERAEGIVAEEAERFRAWQASLDVVPTIASLRARAEEIRSAELSKAKLSDRERAAVGGALENRSRWPDPGDCYPARRHRESLQLRHQGAHDDLRPQGGPHRRANQGARRLARLEAI